MSDEDGRADPERDYSDYGEVYPADILFGGSGRRGDGKDGEQSTTDASYSSFDSSIVRPVVLSGNLPGSSGARHPMLAAAPSEGGTRANTHDVELASEASVRREKSLQSVAGRLTGQGERLCFSALISPRRVEWAFR